MSVGHICVFGKQSIQVHFLIRLFGVLLLNCVSSFYIFDTNPVTVCKYFLHSIGCLFIFLIVLLLGRNFLVDVVPLLIIAFVTSLLVSYQKIIAKIHVKEFFPYVFLQKFYNFRSNI